MVDGDRLVGVDEALATATSAAADVTALGRPSVVCLGGAAVAV